VSSALGIALHIAVVGVAGVLAFSVSAREVSVRLTIASTPSKHRGTYGVERSASR
jgi:hypothetical protein